MSNKPFSGNDAFNPDTWSTRTFEWFVVAVLLFFFVGVPIVFLLPILIYVLRFSGHRISNDPADWADFGDYLTGVYSPILAAAALVVLGLQLIMQHRSMHHQRSHTRAMTARETIATAVILIKEELRKGKERQSEALDIWLIRAHPRTTADEYQRNEYLEKLRAELPKLLPAWESVTMALHELFLLKGTEGFEMAYRLQCEELVATFTMEQCSVFDAILEPVVTGPQLMYSFSEESNYLERWYRD